MNKVILHGNIGQDVELKHLPSGTPVANGSIALTERYTDRNGEKKEKTVWVRFGIFGSSAENAAKFLKKGAGVILEGSLDEANAYMGNDGQPKASNQIRVSNWEVTKFVDGAGNGNSNGGAGYNEPPAGQNLDDIPF
jgi:single-strand DNA-binding protein